MLLLWSALQGTDDCGVGGREEDARAVNEGTSALWSNCRAAWRARLRIKLCTSARSAHLLQYTPSVQSDIAAASVFFYRNRNLVHQDVKLASVLVWAKGLLVALNRLSRRQGDSSTGLTDDNGILKAGFGEFASGCASTKEAVRTARSPVL